MLVRDLEEEFRPMVTRNTRGRCFIEYMMVNQADYLTDYINQNGHLGRAGCGGLTFVTYLPDGLIKPDGSNSEEAWDWVRNSHPEFEVLSSDLTGVGQTSVPASKLIALSQREDWHRPGNTPVSEYRIDKETKSLYYEGELEAIYLMELTPENIQKCHNLKEHFPEVCI